MRHSAILLAGLAACLVGCLAQDEHRIGDRGGAGGLSGGSGAGDGTGGARVPAPLAISPEEAATRLSEVLWSSPPEGAWLATVTPALHNVDDVRALATAMLTDSRARVGVAAFYRWWLSLDRIRTVEKDATLYPQWSAALAADMAREAETFAVNVTLDLNENVATLLTGQFTYMNERLSAIYAVPGITGEELRLTRMPSRLRGGLLALPGFQAMAASAYRNSPTRRGRFVRERFICTFLPPPPPSVPGLPETPVQLPGQTLREAFATHSTQGACSACHVYMDPLGFPFEAFDSLGRERATDNGRTLDLTGQVRFPSGEEKQFDGPLELGNVLAQSRDVTACIAQQWLSFVLGRPAEPSNRDDKRAIDEVVRIAVADNQKLRTLIAAAVASEVFLAP